jgi:hypothetical protein
MIIKGIISIVIFFYLTGIGFGQTEPAGQSKNILILFSMQPTTLAYRVILEGIRSQLTKEFGDSYNLHVEYLETDRYAEGEYSKERFDMYNAKYRNVELDLLICIGINMVSILQQYAESFLLELPVISTDFDFSRYGIRWELSLNNKTVVIPIVIDAYKTISTILQLYPQVDSVYLVCGVSSSDQLQCAAAKHEMNKIKDSVSFTFLENVSMDEVLKRVKHLPGESIVIVPSFNADSKRVSYYNTESAWLISKSANAPVFTFTSMGFGDGAVGGYILNYDKVGLITGDAAVKILNGANTKSIKYTEIDYYQYMLDWRELKRWNILDSDRIPKGSTIMFEEIHFFGKYKWIITAGVLFIMLQTFLIISLVRMNRKQKLMTLQIKNSEIKYRELVREDWILQIAQLTASLSHELRQPLTAILSNAQAGIRFVNSGNNTPELMKEIFENIVEDDKRTASILSSVRGMMKLEKREKERENLNLLISELVAIFRSEANVHNVELNFQLPENPVYIFADATQIQQVILTLSSMPCSLLKIQMLKTG